MAGDKERIDRLKEIFEEAASLWSGGAERTAPGELACRAGCFGCCIGLFEISRPEALLVRHGVSRLSGATRAEILERASRIVRETADSFPGDPGRGILDPDRSEEEDDRYFEVLADRACPMLELPSGRCRIYEERPLTCRTYGLAWWKHGAMIHPPCGLNLVGAPESRQQETGIDLARQDEIEEAARRVVQELGMAAEDETTIAHALSGTAFLEPGP